MSETLTSQQLLHNSYHLAIRSSLLAIQSTLSLQQTMLRSDNSTFADIKSVIASQNANLQRFTKTIAETFPKISSYKPPLPQPRSTPSVMAPARSPPKMALTTTTATGTISVAVSTSTTTTPSITSPILPPLMTPSCCPASPASSHVITIRSTPFSSPSIHTRTDTATSAISLAAPPLPKSPTSPPSPTVAARSIPHPPIINSPLPPLYLTFAPMENNVHYQSDMYYSRAAVFKALCATQNSSWHIELKENNVHNVFVERKKLKREWADASTVFVEMNNSKYERKTFIFDPGGMLHRKSIFDLEDKVNFKGSVMIRLWHKVDFEGMSDDMHTNVQPAHATNTHINARPKRKILLPKRFMD